MSDKDFRSELEMWTDMWDDAQEQNVHPEVPKPVSKDVGFSGDSAQDSYFDYLDSEEIEVLQEESIPNPVYPDSVGPDNERPAAWCKEEFLKEIESLKNKLFKAENEVARLGGDKKWNEKAVNYDPQNSSNDSLMSQVESLRKKIEKVSSHLGLEEEPSPWQIKRD
jgi:hypothetical protein